MELTKEQAMDIAKKYKEQYPQLANKIRDAKFYNKVGKGEDYWMVTGIYEQFEEEHEFYYIVSDGKKIVLETFNEHGSINPHLPTPIPKEWEEYTDEDEI